MADPPKTDEDLPDFFNPNDPEEGENILMKFGINETLLETNNSTENATYATSAIKELVAEATNGLVDIDELQTADQLMAEEQAKRDQGKLLKILIIQDFFFLFNILFSLNSQINLL